MTFLLVDFISVQGLGLFRPNKFWSKNQFVVTLRGSTHIPEVLVGVLKKKRNKETQKLPNNHISVHLSLGHFQQKAQIKFRGHVLINR